jgi:hypothetical protein
MPARSFDPLPQQGEWKTSPAPLKNNLAQLDENLWLLSFPLKLLGLDLRRNVTVIRLNSGKLVIHSSAPFSAQDIEEIAALGQPGWILDSMLRHDTYAEEGRASFPQIPFLAPPGFSDLVTFPTQPILPAPPEWSPELDVFEMKGMPDARETVFLHRPSKTLIVADLVMNFPNDEPLWAELMLKASVGSHHNPGVPRSVNSLVKNEAAFKLSVAMVLTWDFDRIIVGHGAPIESGGKGKLATALRNAGY